MSSEDVPTPEPFDLARVPRSLLKPDTQPPKDGPVPQSWAFASMHDCLDGPDQEIADLSDPAVAERLRQDMAKRVAIYGPAFLDGESVMLPLPLESIERSYKPRSD